MSQTATAVALSETALPPHYDRVQRVFHWLMAAIVLVALALGLASSFLEPGTPVRRTLLEVHKSLGLTALVLIVLRIAYRVTVRLPPYAERLGPATQAAAHAAHGLLYLLMLFMPVTGYVFSGAGGYSLPWFGLFQWPRLVPQDKALAATGDTLHVYGAYALYAVVSLHILAVVWHQVVKRDRVLARMWPSRAALPRA